ncbi:autoinducer binding domain-containing protein [Sphingobium sp. AP49]|uniref:autoinducer binding domain-containing protein n=1 Tax=Sphingobium sp. AP49 TaxID=1144307 RepID=UPI0012F703E6|nr:autoinducer binding domain-containing protein [Sphingobium sp. AP49]WHO40929.1 autoinducer binding domain-containing protein [Sphingobium sp. AP49]
MDKPFWNLIDRIRAASDDGELFNLLDEGTHFIGFTQFAMGHHVDLNQPPEAAIRLTNYNPAWVSESIGRKYYRDDPVHRASVLDNAPFAWDDLKHMLNLTSKQSNILRLQCVRCLAALHSSDAAIIARLFGYRWLAEDLYLCLAPRDAPQSGRSLAR